MWWQMAILLSIKSTAQYTQALNPVYQTLIWRPWGVCLIVNVIHWQNRIPLDSHFLLQPFTNFIVRAAHDKNWRFQMLRHHNDIPRSVTVLALSAK